MTVRIMRGVPGSGKSYHAEEMLKRHLETSGRKGVILSADQWFIDGEGEYKFNPAEIGNAHRHCFDRFSTRLGSNRGRDTLDTLIIIDNTNTRLWECSPYVLAAETYGHDVELWSYRPETRDDLMRIWARNSHGVSWEVVAAMDERFEQALPHWEEYTIPVAVNE
jgi:tRNA uridine 5-carbamoylmethylation protein Kti12